MASGLPLTIDSSGELERILESQNLNVGSILRASAGHLSIAAQSGSEVQIGSASEIARIMGEFRVAEAAQLQGNVTLGDSAADTLTINASLASNIIPDGNRTRNIGDSAHGVGQLWLADVAGAATVDIGSISGASAVGVNPASYANISSSDVAGALGDLDAAISAESLWNRAGTVLSPQTAGDTIQVGAGSVTQPGLAFSDIGLYRSGLTRMSIGIPGTSTEIVQFDDAYTTFYQDHITVYGPGQGAIHIGDSTIAVGSGRLWRWRDLDGDFSLDEELTSGFSSFKQWLVFDQSEGVITVDAEMVPKTTGTRDLGSAALRWHEIYAQHLYLTGSATIGDASADTLTVNASLASNLIPDGQRTRELGSSAYGFSRIWLANITASGTVDLRSTSGAEAVGVNPALYTYISASDLANALGQLDTAIGAITGNTLDQAYDQGGAGVGRQIQASDGAVRIYQPVDGGETTRALEVDAYTIGYGTRLQNDGTGPALATFAKSTGVASVYISQGADGTAAALQVDNAGSGDALVLSGAGARTIVSDAAALVIKTTTSNAITINGAGGVSIVGNAGEIDLTTSGAVDINSGAGTWDASSLGFTASGNIIFDANGMVDPLPLNDGTVKDLAGTFVASTLIGVLNELKSEVISAGTTLDGAYDFGGAGSGRVITADSGAVQITASGNSALNLVQNDANAALDIGGTGARTINSTSGALTIQTATSGVLNLNGIDGVAIYAASGEVSINGSSGIDMDGGAGTWNASSISLTSTTFFDISAGASNDLLFTARGSGTYFNQVGNTALSGFDPGTTSIIGALNELRADLTAETLWNRSGTVLSPQTAGDTVQVSAGVVGAPGVAVGQSDDGLYSVGDGQIGFSANGTEVFNYDSGGLNLTGGSSIARSGNLFLQPTSSLFIEPGTNGALYVQKLGTGNAIELTGTGSRTINSTSADLTISTTTSGNLVLESIGSIALYAEGSEIDITADSTLDLNSAAGTWDASSLSLDATGVANLNAGASSDLTLGARGATITLNQSGDTALDVGFTATSIIGALNELKAASGGGGTLDQAYDYGGAGAGATINADSGPVYIVGTNNSALQLQQSDANNTIDIGGAGTRSINSTSGTLTIKTTTSGEVHLDGADGVIIKDGGANRIDIDTGIDFTCDGAVRFYDAAGAYETLIVTTASSATTGSVSALRRLTAQIFNGGDQVAFDIYQQDSTNNPIAQRITNSSSAAALELAGTGSRVINSTSGDLEISTTTSGNIILDAASTQNVQIQVAGGAKWASYAALNYSYVPLIVYGTTPVLRFWESDQTPTTGEHWRAILLGGSMQIQENTAAGEDFSTEKTWLYFDRLNDMLQTEAGLFRIANDVPKLEWDDTNQGFTTGRRWMSFLSAQHWLLYENLASDGSYSSIVNWIRCTHAGAFSLADGYHAGSTWTNRFELASSSAEWSAVETQFGSEQSLMACLVDAANSVGKTETEFLPIDWAEDGTTAPATAELITSGVGKVRVRKFDSGSDEDVIFSWRVPKDINASAGIKVSVHGVITESTAPSSGQGVAFRINGYSLGTGDALSGTSGTSQLSQTADLNGAGCNAQYDVFTLGQSSTITITNLAAGELAILQVWRDVSETADDYLQDVGITGITIEYTVA